MKHRFSVRISASMKAEIHQAAVREKPSESEIVRLALIQYLGSQPKVRPIDRVRDLIGSFNSGISDLGQRHGEYLRARIRDAQR